MPASSRTKKAVPPAGSRPSSLPGVATAAGAGAAAGAAPGEVHATPWEERRANRSSLESCNSTPGGCGCELVVVAVAVPSGGPSHPSFRASASRPCFT